MLRSALLVGAAGVAALLFACAPIATSSAPSGPGITTCGLPQFLAKVTVVTSAPNFSQGSGVAAPSGVPGNFTAGLTAAFSAAPQAFKDVLCGPGAATGGSGLDAVFVVDASCTGSAECPFQNSAGWWHRTPAGGRQRIVALSSALWGMSYSGYETALAKSLLDTGQPAPQSSVSYSNANIDAVVGMAVLAGLAHEVGHIRWYESINSNPGGFCMTSSGFFGGWGGPTIFQPPHPPKASGGFWRDLLTPSGRDAVRPIRPPPHQGYPYIHSPTGGPQIDAIDNAAGPAQEMLLFKLLSPAASSVWASLFAALAPDEDFVETYKLRVMLTASPPLNSVSLHIGTNPALNIPQEVDNNQRPVLANKLTCISF